jgi:prolyl-tRNA editing enzyme YbaK/EbsC (Cys-tRNA(Pro) deacylase)
MSKLKIFVGSSLEACIQDKFVRKVIENNGIEAVTWKDVFHTGDFTLDSLVKTAQKVHGAIIISTPDDKVWVRGAESLAPRDNILFEMGFFINALGAKHAALIFCHDDKGKSPKIPTDIHGLNVIFFEKGKNIANQKSLEKWILKFKEDAHPMYFHLTEAISTFKNHYHAIPESWIEVIKENILLPFEEKSKRAINGEFILNTTQYYDSILSRLSVAGSETEILAISVLSPEVWERDPLQQRFYEYNVIAKRNGTKIRRLFIASDDQISDYWSIIQKQQSDGISVKVIHPRIFSQHDKLDDSITFKDIQDIRCYRTIQYYDNPYNLKGAELILHVKKCNERIDVFNNVWKNAKTPIAPKFQTKKNYPPPGLTMKPLFLDHEVITCEEAAKARGINLQNELKTLVLQTPTGLIAAHIPGNCVLSLNAVKNAIAERNLKIADPENIAKIGLEAGTVCPILNPIWEMSHIISKKLLSLDFVMTNNGSKRGYYKFDPVVLTNANSIIIGNFERHKEEDDLDGE